MKSIKNLRNAHYPRFSAVEIHIAFHSTHGSDREYSANARALWRRWNGVVEMMSFLPRHRTNVWPRFHLSHAIQVAMKASIR
jgi:hypothetical protein